jgi:hypothetical protein
MLLDIADKADVHVLLVKRCKTPMFVTSPRFSTPSGVIYTTRNWRTTDFPAAKQQ